MRRGLGAKRPGPMVAMLTRPRKVQVTVVQVVAVPGQPGVLGVVERWVAAVDLDRQVLVVKVDPDQQALAAKVDPGQLVEPVELVDPEPPVEPVGSEVLARPAGREAPAGLPVLAATRASSPTTRATAVAELTTHSAMDTGARHLGAIRLTATTATTNQGRSLAVRHRGGCTAVPRITLMAHAIADAVLRIRIATEWVVRHLAARRPRATIVSTSMVRSLAAAVGRATRTTMAMVPSAIAVVENRTPIAIMGAARRRAATRLTAISALMSTAT